MGGATNGSTNAIDQLLGHTKGPAKTPEKAAIDRLDYSKQIVDINFTQLSSLCEDIHSDGFVYFDPEKRSDTEALRANIYADIHNYLSSLYSLVEELHQFLDGCVDQSIDEKTFVRGSDQSDPSLPAFIRKLAFAWGLRNQFTHGNYRCLSITQGTAAERAYMRVDFHEKHFDPRGKGDRQEMGDYLWAVDKDEEDNPMCYLAQLHGNFIDFWDDMIDWSNGGSP